MVIFTPSGCNLGRCYNAAQRRVASFTQAVFTSRTGWDSVVVVGDKQCVGGRGPWLTCLVSLLVAAWLLLSYFID